jgi:peptide/nickel transport system permease protein
LRRRSARPARIKGGNASDFYRQAPWMILFPGVAISLAVFAFNLFGDSLRDFHDPRFKV